MSEQPSSSGIERSSAIINSEQLPDDPGGMEAQFRWHNQYAHCPFHFLSDHDFTSNWDHTRTTVTRSNRSRSSSSSGAATTTSSVHTTPPPEIPTSYARNHNLIEKKTVHPLTQTVSVEVEQGEKVLYETMSKKNTGISVGDSRSSPRNNIFQYTWSICKQSVAGRNKIVYSSMAS